MNRFALCLLASSGHNQKDRREGTCRFDPFKCGEERKARNPIARAIVPARPLRSTPRLADAAERGAPGTGRWDGDILPSVACCYVEITGKDGKKHFLTTEASSAYDAVEKAIDAWSKLWWWDSETVAIVKRNEQSWNISVMKVIEKRLAKHRRPNRNK